LNWILKKPCSLNFKKLGHKANYITIWNQLENNVHFHVIFTMITISFSNISWILGYLFMFIQLLTHCTTKVTNWDNLLAHCTRKITNWDNSFSYVLTQYQLANTFTKVPGKEKIFDTTTQVGNSYLHLPTWEEY